LSAFRAPFCSHLNPVNSELESSAIEEEKDFIDQMKNNKFAMQMFAAEDHYKQNIFDPFFGHHNLSFLGLAVYFGTIFNLLVSVFVCVCYRADFLNLTLALICFYFFHNPETTRKKHFRYLVGALLLSVIFDFFFIII